MNYGEVCKNPELAIQKGDYAHYLIRVYEHIIANNIGVTISPIDKLLQAIDDNLPVRMKRVKLLIPFANAGLANEIRTKGTLICEEYVSEGLEIEAVVDEMLYV